MVILAKAFWNTLYFDGYKATLHTLFMVTLHKVIVSSKPEHKIIAPIFVAKYIWAA